ncbi:MAG: ABC transporter permease [Silvibacterium sp.]|nr:ABC transporter permease [Silvibacterium sp.]
MHTLFQDFRYALRQLQKSLGFTLTAVASLALGIGAATAVFSVIYGILMDPYPYANAKRMAHLVVQDKTGEDQYVGITGRQLQELRQSPVLEDLVGFYGRSLTMTGHDLPEDVQASYLTSNGFNFFGVPPARGRGLLPSDAVDGQDPAPVVVLGYKFWQRHFNSEPSVLGQTMQLLRKNYTIVGVAAPRFTWNDADVYLPAKLLQVPEQFYGITMRLKPGVSHAAANAALQPLMERFAKEKPQTFPGHFRMNVQGLNEHFVKRLGGTLALLFSAVGLLLAIGCGNVSILLLARGTARQQEFAVRAAIGASRRRIIRQLLTEALLLSLTGVALGILLAYRLLALLVTLLPQYSFPHEAAIGINLPVLAFSVYLALLTGILFGLWPALQLSRPEVSQVMQSSSRKIAGAVRGRATHNVLIAAQIALTLVMLAGASAAMEGFLKLIHTPLGYDPHNIMSVGIPLHDGTYKTWAERAAYFEQLRARAATVPGVKITAISSNATPPSNGFNTQFEILGRPSTEQQFARINLVSPEYFPALRIRLAQGRIWNQTENHNAAHLAVINRTLARQYFPNGDAIGHSLKVPALMPQPPFLLTAPGADQWLQIVGVIADKRDDGLRNPIKPEAFVPFTIGMGIYTQILVRSDVPPLSLLHAVAAQVNALDPDQQVNGQVEDLEHWISDQQEWQQEHLVAWIFGAFAVLALALAAAGLYSVVSYTVAQRTNEFGIRMALGAQRSHVLGVVFASAVASVGGGILAGLALTLALNKVLARWAEGSSRDPLILLAVTIVLSAVAALACALPARRASNVDPMTALRYE